jgi:hypothetical protein
MRNPWKEVKSAPQPPLFALPAQAVTLQGLIDHDSGSIVFGVQSVDPINDTLTALWVCPPLPIDRYLKGLHEAHSEFLQQLYDAAGPFS